MEGIREKIYACHIPTLPSSLVQRLTGGRTKMNKVKEVACHEDMSTMLWGHVHHDKGQFGGRKEENVGGFLLC